MSILSVTVNDPGLATKAAEIAFIQRALDHVVTEIARARDGSKTTGTIIGVSASGVPNTSLGSWTYNPSATKP